MPVSGKNVVKLLKKDGWVVDRVSGSHYILRKERVEVTVPVHGNRDLKKGTLASIEQTTGLILDPKKKKVKKKRKENK